MPLSGNRISILLPQSDLVYTQLTQLDPRGDETQTAGIVRDVFELRLAPDRTIVSPPSRYDFFELIPSSSHFIPNSWYTHACSAELRPAQPIVFQSPIDDEPFGD